MRGHTAPPIRGEQWCVLTLPTFPAATTCGCGKQVPYGVLLEGVQHWDVTCKKRNCMRGHTTLSNLDSKVEGGRSLDVTNPHHCHWLRQNHTCGCESPASWAVEESVHAT